eukprot:366063-Chlamydomonas_euryale.AAC.8
MKDGLLHAWRATLGPSPHAHVQQPSAPHAHVEQPSAPHAHVQQPSAPHAHVQQPSAPHAHVQQPSAPPLAGPTRRARLRPPTWAAVRSPSASPVTQATGLARRTTRSSAPQIDAAGGPMVCGRR